MTKSQFAFQSTVAQLFASTNTVYLWTFTFPKVYNDYVVSSAWSALYDRLMVLTGGTLRGVRVYEVHPGGHGLHIHALFDQRIDVNKVRPIATECGFGRINVVRADLRTAGYLAKYLSKESDRPASRMRAWAVIGSCPCTRVRDVHVSSPIEESARQLIRLSGLEKLPYSSYRMLLQGYAVHEVLLYLGLTAKQSLK